MVDLWVQRADASYFTGIPRSRPAVFEWTTRKAAEVGQLSLMYANGVQELVAIAQVVHPPVEAVEGDGAHLTYMAMMALDRRVPREQAKLGPSYGGEFRSLSDDADRATVLRAVRRGNERAAERLDAWLSGQLHRPRGLDARHLSASERAQVPRPSPPRGGELAMQEELRAHLVRAGVARELDRSDGVDLSDTFLLKLPDGANRYADLVLARPARRATRLMLIEVKLEAGSQPARNGLAQLDEYLPLLAQVSEPSWTIERYVIARRFHPLAIQQAAAMGVTALEWNPRDKSLVHRSGPKPRWMAQLA